MTGFARADGAHGGRVWTWEIKSVNGRGLELRCRLPQGFDALEPDLRKAAKEILHRGSINANLTMRVEAAEARYRVNQQALDDALVMIGEIQTRLQCDPPRAESILALRGIIEPSDDAQSDEARKALNAALSASFEGALAALQKAREGEGKALDTILQNQFNDVERLTKGAAVHATTSPKMLRDRIAAQLDELLAGAKLPEERLAQEAAMLAVKADVREELDRLSLHVAAGRALLNQSGAVGRQLDFLTQEFNREANTLCSKASDMELKRIGLELKKVIDQMREQVQNVE